MELVFFSWRRTAIMLALRVKLEEETDGKREEKKISRIDFDETFDGRNFGG